MSPRPHSPLSPLARRAFALLTRSAFAAVTTLVTLAAFVTLALAVLVMPEVLMMPAGLVMPAGLETLATAAAAPAADPVVGLGDNQVGERDGRAETTDSGSHRLFIERYVAESVVGPEDFAIEPSGDLLCSTADGRILRVRVADGRVEELARTGGYPLGLALDRQGNLLIADARRGLLGLDARQGREAVHQRQGLPASDEHREQLALDERRGPEALDERRERHALAPGGEVRQLVTEEGGAALRFTNGVAVGASGAVYFSDSSRRHRPEAVHREALEARPSGRLLRYDPATGAVDHLLDGLFFANGVAVDPEERFVLVAETFAYRVTRYWLRGPQAGRAEPFIEDLPGLPDGVSYSGEGIFNGEGIYWLALFAPRSRLLDALADWPSLRRLLAWLPAALLPAPERYGRVLGLDSEGRVVHDLRDPAGTYAPISSARQAGRWLYLGSLTERGIGRAALR